MTLDDLDAAMGTAVDRLADELTVSLDRETKRELAMLTTALDAEPTELVLRAIHLLYGSTVDTGKLDFHLRSAYDVTYDEYLAGMTYDDMTGMGQFSAPEDDRRYQF